MNFKWLIRALSLMCSVLIGCRLAVTEYRVAADVYFIEDAEIRQLFSVPVVFSSPMGEGAEIYLTESKPTSLRDAQRIIGKLGDLRKANSLQWIAADLRAEFSALSKRGYILCTRPFALAYGGNFPVPPATNPSDFNRRLLVPLITDRDLQQPIDFVVIYADNVVQVDRRSHGDLDALAKVKRRVVHLRPSRSIEDLLDEPELWLNQ